MKPLTDIGEMRLSESIEGGKDYFFKPSFEAMASIGTPEEIVSTFSLVHGAGVQELIEKVSLLPSSIPQHMLNALFHMPGEKILTASMQVLRCCYKGHDDLTPLIGEWKGWSNCVVYRPGALPKEDIIVLAQHLMQHGVVGKAKIRKLQRHENNEYSTEFKAIDYIMAARNHFGMSRDDAASLSMTEFTMLLAAKYPDQKGFTSEEYESVADDFLARQAHKRALAAQQQ